MQLFQDKSQTEGKGFFVDDLCELVIRITTLHVVCKYCNGWRLKANVSA